MFAFTFNLQLGIIHLPDSNFQAPTWIIIFTRDQININFIHLNTNQWSVNKVSTEKAELWNQQMMLKLRISMLHFQMLDTAFKKKKSLQQR